MSMIQYNSIYIHICSSKTIKYVGNYKGNWKMKKVTLRKIEWNWIEYQTASQSMKAREWPPAYRSTCKIIINFVKKKNFKFQTQFEKQIEIKSYRQQLYKPPKPSQQYCSVSFSTCWQKDINVANVIKRRTKKLKRNKDSESKLNANRCYKHTICFSTNATWIQCGSVEI